MRLVELKVATVVLEVDRIVEACKRISIVIFGSVLVSLMIMNIHAANDVENTQLNENKRDHHDKCWSNTPGRLVISKSWGVSLLLSFSWCVA